MFNFKKLTFTTVCMGLLNCSIANSAGHEGLSNFEYPTKGSLECVSAMGAVSTLKLNNSKYTYSNDADWDGEYKMSSHGSLILAPSDSYNLGRSYRIKLDEATARGLAGKITEYYEGATDEVSHTEEMTCKPTVQKRKIKSITCHAEAVELALRSVKLKYGNPLALTVESGKMNSFQLDQTTSDYQAKVFVTSEDDYGYWEVRQYRFESKDCK